LVDLVTPPGGNLPVTLADGRRVALRPIPADDKDRIRQGMVALSPLSRRHRFFSAKDELDEDVVTYLTEIDYRSHFAWVAVAVDRSGQPIVAVGRYIAMDGLPPTAEIAFVVADDYQRQGLGTMLLDLLAVVARDTGIDRFYARVLDDNVPMRRMLAHAGAKLDLDEAGVLQTTIEVPQAGGPFDPAPVLAIARAAALRRSA